MQLELDGNEVKLLLKLLEGALRERRPGTAGSPGDREHGTLDRGRVEGLKRKLQGPTASEGHREHVVDHSIEESFPASDPPARSVARETGPEL
jgi:hypothetical protein